ncbi:MAG: hypothetical protein U0231_14520 [Nitrospiraceae bacterium]
MAWKRFLDESRFPADAERLGLGISDGALFDFMADRIRSLRSGTHPYFFTTLTLNTHHPQYVPPLRHPDVAALRPISIPMFRRSGMSMRNSNGCSTHRGRMACSRTRWC